MDLPYALVKKVRRENPFHSSSKGRRPLLLHYNLLAKGGEEGGKKGGTPLRPLRGKHNRFTGRRREGPVSSLEPFSSSLGVGHLEEEVKKETHLICVMQLVKGKNCSKKDHAKNPAYHSPGGYKKKKGADPPPLYI